MESIRDLFWITKDPDDDDEGDFTVASQSHKSQPVDEKVWFNSQYLVYNTRTISDGFCLMHIYCPALVRSLNITHSVKSHGL